MRDTLLAIHYCCRSVSDHEHSVQACGCRVFLLLLPLLLLQDCTEAVIPQQQKHSGCERLGERNNALSEGFRPLRIGGSEL